MSDPLEDLEDFTAECERRARALRLRMDALEALKIRHTRGTHITFLTIAIVSVVATVVSVLRHGPVPSWIYICAGWLPIAAAYWRNHVLDRALARYERDFPYPPKDEAT